MKSIKKQRGITLIALAVTIVVILILAGVTIDAVFSENGIINKAKEAADRMNDLVKEDEAKLNELLNELNETMDSNWNSNIEIPEENTIPEPDPKPPKLEDTTGMQDETIKVEDEYGNKVTIPKGFEVVEEEGTTVPEGIVIQDKDKNQFVWIPVGRVYKDASKTNYSDIQLGRYTFNTTNGNPTLVQAAYTEENPRNYEQSILLSNQYQEYKTRFSPDGIASSGTNGLNAIAKDLADFVNSVRDNGGYYLGRYEASYGSGSSVADYKPLSQVSKATSFSTSTEGSLWNKVTQIDAAKISRNMYSESDNVGVESDLLNSYAWDTAIIFIQEMGNTNYANKKTVNTILKNTGTTGDFVCNIHDMSSNCREWTTEFSNKLSSSTAWPCTIRGGFFENTAHYTAIRYEKVATENVNNETFRVLLYLKQ